MIGDEKTEKKPDPEKPQINVVTHADYERHKKAVGGKKLLSKNSPIDFIYIQKASNQMCWIFLSHPGVIFDIEVSYASH